MAMIRVSFKTDKGYDQILKEIKAKERKIINAVMNMGIATKDKMKNTVIENIKRPGSTGKLVGAITYEDISAGDYIGWGVGNIDILNKEAPYWKIQNFGSSHIVGKDFYGFFQPGEEHPDVGHFREGRFYEQGDFGWKMTPKNPIPPMNYISKTVHFLEGQFIKIRGILEK